MHVAYVSPSRSPSSSLSGNTLTLKMGLAFSSGVSYILPHHTHSQAIYPPPVSDYIRTSQTNPVLLRYTRPPLDQYPLLYRHHLRIHFRGKVSYFLSEQTANFLKVQSPRKTMGSHNPGPLLQQQSTRRLLGRAQHPIRLLHPHPSPPHYLAPANVAEQKSSRYFCLWRRPVRLHYKYHSTCLQYRIAQYTCGECSVPAQSRSDGPLEVIQTLTDHRQFTLTPPLASLKSRSASSLAACPCFRASSSTSSHATVLPPHPPCPIRRHSTTAAAATPGCDSSANRLLRARGAMNRGARSCAMALVVGRLRQSRRKSRR